MGAPRRPAGAVAAITTSPLSSAHELQLVWELQGFVRLAVETGATLVPVICFGENDLFDAEVVGADTFMGRFQKCGTAPRCLAATWLAGHAARSDACSRASKTLLLHRVGAFCRKWGPGMSRWGLKHVGITSPNFSWLGPHRVPIDVVCGAPLKVMPSRDSRQSPFYNYQAGHIELASLYITFLRTACKHHTSRSNDYIPLSQEQHSFVTCAEATIHAFTACTLPPGLLNC